MNGDRQNREDISMNGKHDPDLLYRTGKAISAGWPDLDGDRAVRLHPAVGEQWMRILFPSRCVLCDAVMPQNAGLLVCTPCRCILEPETPKWHSVPEWPEIEAWYSPFPYAGGVEHAIRQMKYNGQPRHAGTLAFLLAEAIREMDDSPVFTGIIPVPMHGSKQRARGYNQAVLLANALKNFLDIPVYGQSVEKTSGMRAQNGLSRQERFAVLHGSFVPAPGGEVPRNPQILLLDDVTTTGSTLRACASAIHAAYAEVGAQAGTIHIHAATIAFA